jgi:hypothetical protein
MKFGISVIFANFRQHAMGHQIHSRPTIYQYFVNWDVFDFSGDEKGFQMALHGVTGSLKKIILLIDTTIVHYIVTNWFVGGHLPFGDTIIIIDFGDLIEFSGHHGYHSDQNV